MCLFFYVQLMAQSLETICLTKEQINTVLNNIWTIRKLKMDEKIFEGKPSFSKEIVDEYKYKMYTKFADNYVIYKCFSLEDNHIEIFITVESDHYDKQHLLAIVGFQHMIFDYLRPSCSYKRPTINICLCFVITKTMKQHLPTEIFGPNCNSRMFSLCSLYPMIGSKTTLYSGLTYDYELIKNEDIDDKYKHNGVPIAYNNKEFSIVLADDPMAIAVNAITNDLIAYKRIIHDTSIYSEYQIRIVKNKLSSLDVVSKSGMPAPIPSFKLKVSNYKEVA